MVTKLSHGLFFVVALTLLGGSGAAFAAPASSAPSCSTLSANFLQHLEKGDFAAATGPFTDRMKTGLGADKLKQIWQQSLPQQFGAFERAATTTKIVRQGSHSAVITPLRFTHGWLDMSVNCNDQHQIEGLFFRPGTAPASATAKAPASATAWITNAAASAKTLPITVQRDGFVLKGVLDLPAGKGPFPVVDLIPGSGPVDINGNGRAKTGGGIGYSPYKKLAAALIKAGWAVARVAKRGMPPSTGDGNRVVFEDQVADNLAVVEALRKNPYINSKRIVVAGHSLGGLIAPKLATETKLAGLILLEAPGESMTKIFNTQAIEMAQQAGAGATAVTAIKQGQEKAYRQIEKAPPGQSVTVHFKKGKRTFPAYEVALFKSWFTAKPLATARKINIPVLVVQGGMDFNVPPGNGKRLVAALPDGKLLYLPEMGHALDVASCRCTKQLDTGKDATLAPGLAAGIVHWLHTL